MNIEAILASESGARAKAKEQIAEIERLVGKDFFTANGYIDSNSIKAVDLFEKIGVNVIKKAVQGKEYDGVVVLCIGSACAKYIADNIGPMTGSLLKQKAYIKDIHIKGTMEEPVDGFTFQQTIEKINQKYSSPFIVSVDAVSTYAEWQLEHIHVRPGAIRAGASFGHNLPEVGDVSVAPIVIHREKQDTVEDMYDKIKKADKYTVDKLAQITASGIYSTLKTVTQQGVILLDR